MAIPNSGHAYTLSIPVDGIIIIDFADFVASTADIFHVEITGGGVLKGIKLVDNGMLIAPSAETWYTTFTVSASVGTVLMVGHLAIDVPIGEQIYCPAFLADTLMDEHDHFFRYSYDAALGRWLSKANTWVGA